MMKRIVLGILLVGLVGCSPNGQQSSGQKKQSGASDAIDTVVIQKGKVESGRKAANKVKEVGAQRQQDLDEVMGQ
jgi:hypothetical protein